MEVENNEKHLLDPVGPGEYRTAPKEQMVITLSAFARFMSASGRSHRCPGCGFDGGWVMQGYAPVEEPEKNDTDAESGPQRDGLAKVFYHSAMFDSDDKYPVVLAECPRCGLVQSTSAARILRYIKEGE